MDIKKLMFMKATAPKEHVSLLDCRNYSYKTNDIGSITKDSFSSSAVETGNFSKIKWGEQSFGAGNYTLTCAFEGAGTKGVRLLCSVQIEGSTYNNSYGMYWIDFTDTITFETEESFTLGMVVKTNTAGEPGKFYNISLAKN